MDRDFSTLVSLLFFFNDTATTEIYTLSLHDALPISAAHVAERNAHHYLPIVFGLQITCCDDPRQVLSYLPEVRPSWFFAVPRIWEKLKAGLETMIAAQPPEQREATQAALDAALQKVRAEQRGE